MNLKILQKFHNYRYIQFSLRNFSAKPKISATARKRQSNFNKIHDCDNIFEHHNLNEKTEILKKFPIKLLRKKQKTPDSFYLVNENSAKIISNHLLKNLSPETPILEVNPGPGLLTKVLLENNKINKIQLIENYVQFLPYLEELKKLHADRVQIKHGEFVHLWKLSFQDKLDNGTRLQEFLINLPRKEFTDDVNVRIYGGIGSYNFFKHLINCLVFQTSILSFGRCEMFLLMPPPLYIHLTCNSEAGYLLYRATSILFQIMFEHQFITKIPRENFLPWQNEHNLSKSNKLTKINSIDPDYLYLVKIVPRKNLYELCSLEDMPALWYFIKQNCVSRKNRIIPNLEKWVPGCGPRLIVNQKKSKNVEYLYSNEDIINLPKYSTRCTTMNNQNYVKSINIFSQFGDLTPNQILTLFCEFRNWPEYKQSPFLASLENSLLKMENAAEDNVDGLEIVEEDDVCSTMEKLEPIKTK